jgi:hypothetical protein
MPDLDDRAKAATTAIGSTIVALLAYLVGVIDLLVQGLHWLWGYAAATDNLWFGLSGAIATVSRRFDAVPEWLGTALFAAAVALFAAIALEKMADKALERL